MKGWQLDACRHAESVYPREACGLIVKTDAAVFFACENRASGNDHFTISAQDYAAAEQLGEIVGVFHSHPDASANPSEADRTSCEASGLAWHILALPSKVWGYCEPSGYRAPLVGRPFYHGVLDCYSLIRDYYDWELGKALPDFERNDDWWHHNKNLYIENFGKAGFRKVEALEVNDVILMQVQSPVVNHGAIYLGNDKILHHLHGRLSCRDVYGGYWRKVTHCIVRHA